MLFRNYRYASLVVVILPMLCFECNLARAYEWTNNYGTDLTVGYDDNFRLSAVEENQIETVWSSLGVFADINGATEISNIRLVFGANGFSYSDKSIDDRNSYNILLDGQRSGERLDTFIAASFRQDLTVESELLDTGVIEDGTRDTVTVAPGLRYRVDERNAVTARYSFRDVSYDTVSLTEYMDNALSLGWDYLLDETSSVSAGIRSTRYESEAGSTSETESVNIGYSLKTSEVTTYNFSYGYSGVDRSGVTDTSNNYSINVNYRQDELDNFILAASRGYRSSGSGGVRLEDRLDLRWNRGLTDRSQFRLSIRGVAAEDRDYFSIQPGIKYQYSPEISTFTSYRYRVQTDDFGDANSSSLLFTLTYSPI